MHSRFGHLMVAAATIVITLFVAADAVPGQTTSFRATRGPDGKPNFNGIWQAINTANWNIEAHQAEPGPFHQLGAAGAVPSGFGVVDGDIPYTPDGLRKKLANAANRLTRDPEIKCYLPGVPRATYLPFPFQIVQSQKHVMFVHEYTGAIRTVYMDNHIDAPADSWMGWSNGRWEGEALVIDTKGFNGLAWFDRAGNHASDTLHVVERITARSAETLNYDVTLEDPKTFTRAWKMTMPLYKRVEKNVQLGDFRCVEFSEDVIYGHLAKPKP